jgi:hypothetical protein
MAAARDITVGVRGTFGIAAGTDFAGDTKTAIDANESYLYTYFGVDSSRIPNLGGGFGVYCNFGFADAGYGTFGLQPEFDMFFNNGLSEKFSTDSSWTRTTYSAHSIDIPVLVTYNISAGKVVNFGFGVGPYLSIPFGLNVATEDSDGTDYSDGTTYFTDGVNFGAAFDLTCGFRAGKGNFVLDFRYFSDFTNTKGHAEKNGAVSDTDDLLIRRTLIIGAGYEIKF